MADAAPKETPAEMADSRSYRFYVLFILFLVYTFNFIDRQIIGILAGPIKAELGLSDTQLGLMGGLAFALFYTGLGIPIALLADRFSRVKIVTVSLAIWSGFTALCGTAHGFWQLFLYRVGVGVGEAGGVAPSYSLISDYFPPKERARAFAVFSFGIPVGSAAGILFGGLIAAQVDWRAAFLACGLAGLVLAPVMWLTVREPARGRFDPVEPKAAAGTATDEAPPVPDRPVGLGWLPFAAALLAVIIAFVTGAIGWVPFVLLAIPAAVGAAFPFLLRRSAVLRALAGKPSFWLIAFGASASSIMGYGLIFWLPSFLDRSFGMSLVDRSIYYSAIVFFGGLVGIWMGGYLGDRLGQSSKAAYALVPGTAFLLSVPFYATGVLSGSLLLTFFMFLIPAALSLVWLGPVITTIQQLVAPSMRATASAVFLFINNLIGIGFGTVFLGLLSDFLVPRFGAESLRYSILIGLAFYVVAAVLFFLASRRLARDWHQ